jgi:ATP-dependent protease HslVU (ClpYQ) peptidase subunit
MSTIVIVKKNGKAVIAADSRTTYQNGGVCCDAKYNEHFDKIHRANEAYVGIVGTSAHQQVFENIIEKYPADLSFKNRKHIFLTALKLHKRLKEDFHVLTREDENGQPYESSQIDCLIISPGGIFGLYSYRQVTQYARFWAIGSGSNFALGAMFAVYNQLEDPQAIAQAGINAAAEFDSGSALPLTSYSLNLAETL